MTNQWGKYPVMILPYQTYGTEKKVYLRGRVMEDKNIRLSKDDNFYDLLKNTYKRFQTDEKPGESVTAKLGSIEYQSVTDFEGFFRIHQPIKPIEIDQSQNNWIDVYFELANDPNISAKSQMMIPKGNVDFGIISDIDDTILQTGVTSFLKLKVLYNTLLKNATERQPLQGASPFYRALEKGPNANNSNPFFYISNSPWNLYNYLKIFLREAKFPKGPILLRDFAFPWDKNFETEKSHKQREITDIFKTYPNMKFILFGDSAEHDASIYSEAAKEFPEQVICVYLHTVKSKTLMRRIQTIVEGSEHVEMVLVNNALQAAEHALSKSLISAEAYKEILKEVQI